jgi:hypothetical protein
MLSILIGAIVIDILFLILNFNNTIFISEKLTEWYTLFGPSAMAMDILIITLACVLGLHISKTVHTKPFLIEMVGWVTIVQIVHDILFACVFSYIPFGKSFIMDFFKKYAAEVGVHAIWSDTLMVIGTLLVSEHLQKYNIKTQQIILMISLYVGFFALYSKKQTRY